MKVGRNDLCPCGNGKKFKKCHLIMPPLIPQPDPSGLVIPDHIWRKFEEHHRKEQARAASFGKIRPMIQWADYHGYRLVVVRNRVYYSKKWKFFADFLTSYVALRFGKDWLDAQNSATPAEQHPLYIWRKQAYEFIRRLPPQPDGTFAGVPNSPTLACHNFYYDLYTVDDNTILDENLLARLKDRNQFQGALHELFVEATCLRAGFTIIRENEKDRNRKHVEFTAVHKATGQHVLVEAKSRHRAGVMAMPGKRVEKPDTRFRMLINQAIAKDPNNPMAIFVDANLPPERANRFFELRSKDPLVPSLATESLMRSMRKDHDGRDPYNILVFSNHPERYAEDDEIAPGNRWFSIISDIPRIPVFYRKALFDLAGAVNLYGNVPTLFPENPNAA